MSAIECYFLKKFKILKKSLNWYEQWKSTSIRFRIEFCRAKRFSLLRYRFWVFFFLLVHVNWTDRIKIRLAIKKAKNNNNEKLLTTTSFKWPQSFLIIFAAAFFLSLASVSLSFLFLSIHFALFHAVHFCSMSS